MNNNTPPNTVIDGMRSDNKRNEGPPTFSFDNHHHQLSLHLMEQSVNGSLRTSMVCQKVVASKNHPKKSTDTKQVVASNNHPKKSTDTEQVVAPNNYPKKSTDTKQVVQVVASKIHRKKSTETKQVVASKNHRKKSTDTKQVKKPLASTITTGIPTESELSTNVLPKKPIVNDIPFLFLSPLGVHVVGCSHYESISFWVIGNPPVKCRHRFSLRLKSGSMQKKPNCYDEKGQLTLQWRLKLKSFLRVELRVDDFPCLNDDYVQSFSKGIKLTVIFVLARNKKDFIKRDGR
jgi:hypothetical protein